MKKLTKGKVESEAKSITQFSTQTIKGQADEVAASAKAEAAAAYWPEMYLAENLFIIRLLANQMI